MSEFKPWEQFCKKVPKPIPIEPGHCLLFEKGYVDGIDIYFEFSIDTLFATCGIRYFKYRFCRLRN